MKCQHCSMEMANDSKFCPGCGQPQRNPGIFCPVCGLEVTPGQRFCRQCGKGVEASWPPGGVSAPTAGAVLPPSVVPRPAGVGLRCIEGLLDLVVLFILGYLIAAITGQTTENGFELHGEPAFIWMFAGLGYYIFFEGKWGSTPGKMLVGLKVIKEDGSRCDMRSALIRNVCRIVDNFFAVGVIIMLASERNQRLGDRLAGTLVVKGK